MEYKHSKTTIDAETVLQAIADGMAIHLDHCRITGALDFNRFFSDEENFNTQNLEYVISEESQTVICPEGIRFNNCKFEEDVVFSGPWDRPEYMQVVFKKEILFNSSHFCGQARFSKAKFQAMAGFDGCRFGRICAFRNTVFQNRTMFRTVTFEGYGLFNGADFSADTRFANTLFGKGSNFTDVKFRNRCDFSGVYSRSKSVPIYENVQFTRKRFGDDASFWRFIKQVCQEAGYYQQAGECFYRERCAHFWRRFRGSGYEKLSILRKAIRWISGLRLLPEFILGRLLFGYGERPTRVLASGAVIILACAVFYSSNAARLAFQYGLADTQPSEQLRFFEGLYYSTVTFTTLGFGDIYPAADILTRMVTMVESLAGACLMALFVVTLSKRFSRG